MGWNNSCERRILNELYVHNNKAMFGSYQKKILGHLCQFVWLYHHHHQHHHPHRPHHHLILITLNAKVETQRDSFPPRPITSLPLQPSSRDVAHRNTSIFKNLFNSYKWYLGQSRPYSPCNHLQDVALKNEDEYVLKQDWVKNNI